jgi:hypothetical protein
VIIIDTITNLKIITAYECKTPQFRGIIKHFDEKRKESRGGAPFFKTV